MRSLGDAKSLRGIARQARMLAATTGDRANRRLLLDIAARYEKPAEKAGRADKAAGRPRP